MRQNYALDAFRKPSYKDRHLIVFIYFQQQPQYPVATESECVVPNITVEVPNVTLPEHSTYAPYPDPDPPVYDSELAVVPPAIVSEMCLF